ncbi:prephenate dehydratase [Sphingomonas ginkgonis]|uniref:prephenate dehydratase n=1 Tax=Sphingomonas ginkgonis TaxID=2315330 RepID=A0A3R9YK32_9SPHN|nr:prephenate dehydratase domain-containing protein [Sphingomonas ginkgonis]RST29536.1 prephenate dehydratase [Sphingomonas ginkgonis]
MSVAYQGAPGAFGHAACRRFLPGHEPVARPSFAEVIRAVEADEADLGMLPLENNHAGPTGAGPLIAGSTLRIVAEHDLPVRMHLLGLPGTELRDIRLVRSHPVAIRQCAATLGGLGLASEPAENTAVAALALADRGCAVLASEEAAALYGLAILRRDVHDRPDNATRFAVVAKGAA